MHDAGNGLTPSELETEIPHLRRYARHLTGDPDRADDLVQDCLLRALTRAHRFQPGSNLRAWLTTILRNLHVDSHRRDGRRSNALTASGYGRVTSSAANQEWSVEVSQLSRRIAGMPAHDRQVLSMIGVAGLSTMEAAQALDLPPGTVKSRLSRARKRLATAEARAD